jgi:hypothetical protein
MHVWVLRGSGPAHALVLGSVDLVLDGEADDAIDLLQVRALRMHADAIVHTRIEHVDGRVLVHGVAVRFR